MENVKALIQKLKKYNRIIVYGAGGVGNVVTCKLVSDYPELPLESVAISSNQTGPFYLYGVPVCYIDDLIEKVEDSVVLIATKENIQQELKENLQALGFTNILAMTDELYEKWRSELKETGKEAELVLWKRYKEPYLKSLVRVCQDYHWEEKRIRGHIRQEIKNLESDDLYMARCVVVLGTKCSLRCKECNNLMPYFKPQKDIELSTIISSFGALLDKAKKIVRCELIGGEPFLSKNLYAVLSFVLSKDNVAQIEITTNGAIVPEERLISLLQNDKVKVRISDYGTLVNKERVVHFLKTNHIHFEELEHGGWISPGGVQKRGRDRAELQTLYERCDPGYLCKALYDGKLFSCARAASLYALEYMKEPEYIFITEDVTKDEIKEFLLKRYSEACDYCDITSDDRVMVPPAEQI